MLLVKRRNRCSMRAVGVSLFLAASVLFSSLLAVSQALHQVVHKDAKQQDHQCVVTMLQKHQVSAAATHSVASSIAANIVGFVSFPKTLTPSFCEHFLPETRGPPAAPALITVAG